MITRVFVFFFECCTSVRFYIIRLYLRNLFEQVRICLFCLSHLISRILNRRVYFFDKELKSLLKFCNFREKIKVLCWQDYVHLSII